MKKIFLTGTLALAASLGGLTVSCGDFLDITPLNAVVVQNYWEKKSEVERDHVLLLPHAGCRFCPACDSMGRSERRQFDIKFHYGGR